MNKSIVRFPPQPLAISETCMPRRIHTLLTPKWTSMVIYVLSFGALRTGQLQRAMVGVSKKMLTQTLRELEADGLIERKVHQVVPPMVEYSLTTLGQGFVEPLMTLYSWAESNAGLLDQLEHNRKQSAVLADAGDTMAIPK